MSLMVSKKDMLQLKLEPFKMTTFLLSLMAQMSTAEHPFKYLLTLHNINVTEHSTVQGHIIFMLLKYTCCDISKIMAWHIFQRRNKD